MKPIGFMADLHNHNWNAFATVNGDGVNGRLQMLLDEILRCAQEVVDAGGSKMILAGDIFHVRGSIAPSVLNPVRDCMRRVRDEFGIVVYILAGNHDLEGKKSTRLGSAITALETDGCIVINTVQAGLAAIDDVVMIPWIQDIAELKQTLEDAAKSDPKPGEVDLVIHAPIDGVIAGLPPHGLTPEYLAGLGFRRVFAGHYHHHKDFGNGVYSIGALAHHTWSDVGSKAGFLIVSDDEVKWFKSHAPEFVDLSRAADESEAELMTDGNYVRARVSTSKPSDIAKMREWLEKSGAKGVVIQTVKEPAKARTGSVAHSVKAGASIEASIDEFIKGQSFAHAEKVRAKCQNILSLAGV